ncbi:ATP-binding protein [uncultured Tateyamaria sp.]|uniref:ATP-binding protein n=1 Tax=uncultured Tateyamaria sp. TaxID=455651 RepID=UPI0026153826|nr:ATP-binding protein [uncultured Tateyamaria sp.]
MMRLIPRSVRGRLWTALGLLALAIVCISSLTWIALQRVDARLQDLHQQSLGQVAQAIDLSKRSSDLATSAPYLLNQRSNFLIQQEGEKLLDVLAQVRDEWPTSSTTETDREALSALTLEMENGIRDLVKASQSLDQVQAVVRARVAELSTLREDVTLRVEDQASETQERLTWWTLHSMNADALNAAYADNLIGVGEEQRHFRRKAQLASDGPMTFAQTLYLNRLNTLVRGDVGIFELRRQELDLTLDAQNALFRIRRDANHINELATDFAKRAEAVLTQERSSSSSTIQFTRVSVAAISLAALGLALVAALYVSRYVAFNVGRVSEAMVRLANGDRSSVLPRRLGGDDEIGDLFRSFRSFRANALRLDRSNRQLDQRNALFEKVFANITDGIAITDSTGKLTASNPAFERILDIGNLRESFVDWLYRSAFGRSAKDAGLSVQHRGHLVLDSAKGDVLEIRASRLPDEGRVWLISDVTEQHRVAERVAQIDRIELLGKLAGDTAHDFANILSTIRTHAHLLDDTRSETANVSAIENAVDYGAALTDRLLAFARKQPLSPEVFDLNALVEGMVELIEIGLKPNVTLEVVPAAEPLNVLADPGQLESAIVNLVLNSNNAIENAGTIRVTLTKTKGGGTQIIVSDTGSGMSKSTQEKAIQPFFTTRARDGGTGLGLSIVYGFINQSGGKLDIDSQKGKGTRVTVRLPCVDTHGSATQVRGAGRALLLDDNETDLKTTAKALKFLGYAVTSCSTAQEALRLAKQGEFDLLVSDFELGGAKDGLDVLTSLEKHDPDTQRILISGKSSLRAVQSDSVLFIEKPVCSESLSKILK